MSSGSSSEVEALKAEIESLRAQIEQMKGGDSQDNEHSTDAQTCDQPQKTEGRERGEEKGSVTGTCRERTFGAAQLTKRQIERYSRQMLCPDLGPMGTRALLDSKVLVVGAGGLGATAIPYLVAAGVGHIIIVDFDTVDESNLHRQIIHTEGRVGMLKAKSAKIFAESLNSKDTVIETVCEPFSVENAQALCRRVDVVIDASDNVACRYLVNDAAVLEGKPLVSGCATRWEGQMTVYNCRYPVPPPQQATATKAQQKSITTTTTKSTSCDGSTDTAATLSDHDRVVKGPCYRCLFPTPTPASSVGSCNEVGVLGPVPGMIGCLQALEAIKVLTMLSKWKREDDAARNATRGKADLPSPTDKFGKNIDLLVGRMLLFDGLRSTYKAVRIRGQQSTCVICNPQARVAHGLLSPDDVNKPIPLTALKDAHYGPRRLFPEYSTGVLCELPDSAPRVDKPLILVNPNAASPVMMAAAGVTAIEGKMERNSGDSDEKEDIGKKGERPPLPPPPQTLTSQTGILCRETTAEELKQAIDARLVQRAHKVRKSKSNDAIQQEGSAVSSADNTEQIEKNGCGRVIVVDVRPSTQQAIFSLHGSECETTSREVPRDDDHDDDNVAISNERSEKGKHIGGGDEKHEDGNLSALRVLSFDGDTFDGLLDQHVDTILEAVREESSKVPPHLSTRTTSVRRISGSKRNASSALDLEEESGVGENKEGEEERTTESTTINTSDGPDTCPRVVPIYFLCRRGNKSRRAIYAVAPLISERLKLQEAKAQTDTAGSSSSDLVEKKPKETSAHDDSSINHHSGVNVELVNVIGGLTYWARDVDNGFPQI